MATPLILFSVFATSVLSGVLGMAGGLVLKGVLVALVPVTVSMILHGWIQMVANGSRAWGLRSHIDWPGVGRYTAGASVAVTGFLIFPWVPSPIVIYAVLGALPFLAWITPARFRPDFSRPIDSVVTGLAVNATQLLAGVAGTRVGTSFLDRLSEAKFRKLGKIALTLIGATYIGIAVRLWFGGSLPS